MRTIVLAAIGFLTLGLARAEASPITVTFTMEAQDAAPDFSFATGTGSVTFDPDIFPFPDGAGGGEGPAISGTLTFSGLAAYGALVDTTTFSMPFIPLDVFWSPIGCGCFGTDPLITVDTGNFDAPLFAANSDGFYLIAFTSDGILLTDYPQDSGSPDPGPSSQLLPFFTTVQSVVDVPEPATFALLGLSVIGLAGGRAWGKARHAHAAHVKAPTLH